MVVDHQEDDSDDEFQMEEFETCLKLAEDALAHITFDTAEKFFEKTLLLRKSLSRQSQNGLPLEDIYLKLAKCCISQGK
jgi:hypothetical protein